MERVLNTPELCEIVLLSLPLSDLLQSQRINKHFHQLVTRSPAIQQRLFFRSRPTASSPSDGVLNPLLTHYFPLWFQTDGEDEIDRSLNYPTFDEQPFASDPKRLAAFTRPEASWRRMLVAQPIIPQLKVVQCRHARGGTTYSTAIMNLEDGLRMGLFYDLTVEWNFGIHRVARFSVEWRHLPKTTAVDQHMGNSNIPDMIWNSFECPLALGGLDTLLVLTYTHQCKKGLSRPDPQFQPLSSVYGQLEFKNIGFAY